MVLLYRGVYCIEHSRIESLEERVNVLVFAHGPLLAYASTAHGIAKLPGAFSPPYRGVASSSAPWQLARMPVVEKVRNNLSLLSRIAVPYTRPLIAKDV